MYTSAELQLLRSADPGVQIAGIDTPAGNPLSESSLKSLSSLTTNPSAPIYFNAARNVVYVKGAGAVLSGYDLGNAQVDICAPNVTIADCSFSNPSAIDYFSIADEGFSGLTVSNCTFNGGDSSTANTTIFTEDAYVTIANNAFLDTPSHGVQLDDGVISGNYFSGGGYQSGAHADAIQIENTTGPITISGNFIDWTNNPDALAATNNAIRISTDCGNTSNVTITDNVLLGGGYTVTAGTSTIVGLAMGATGTLGTTGVITNVTITGNDIGWGGGGAFYPNPPSGVTESGNTIVDYTNPIYAANAWTAYQAAGVGTQYLVQSTGGTISGNSNGTTTLYGGAYHVAMIGQGAHETVFVGGSGAQQMGGGSGANIFKFLSIGDSPGNGAVGLMANFDPAKDVIDLSAINSNPGGVPGASSNFTFIGTSAFTAAGDEVRYEYVASANMTFIEANLAGDDNYGSNPDFFMRLSGNIPLTAANFALTTGQSTADMAAGAALSISSCLHSGNACELFYTNVTGRPYASYQSIQYASNVAADDLNLNSTSDEIDLFQNSATITRGAGAESFAIGTGAFSLAYRANETIQVGNSASAIALSSGFGAVTINGFSAAGTGADTLKLSTSAFSYLNPGMTQAQDLAAVLSQSSAGPAGLTIADSAGDSLTLAGVTASALASTAAAVKFV